MMPDDIDGPQTLQAENTKREAYAEKLSDRTRTSCLGALAVIWAIFNEKKGDQALAVSGRSKIALLGVAFVAILVLSFDFAESAFGYLRVRETSGDNSVTKMPYKAWENSMRFGKLTLGPIALIALCLVLACILCSSLHCQTFSEQYFYGTWCGVDNKIDSAYQNTSYRCIDVHAPGNTLKIAIGYPKSGDELQWFLCRNYSLVNSQMWATCSGEQIQLSPTSSRWIISYKHEDPQKPGAGMFESPEDGQLLREKEH